MSDFGLEPPKIYRESQNNYSKPEQPKRRNDKTTKRNENLTRSQKRAKETKKRKKRNLIRKIFGWVCAVAVVLAVGTVLSLTVFFNINSITVSGNSVYSQEEVLAQCSIDVGENLFLADTDSAKERLEQTLPYIYNVQIKRKLPATIQIKITEAEVSYSVKSDDKTYILLDDNFKVLELGAQKAQGIKISKANVKKAVAGYKIEFANEDVGDCLQQLAQVVEENDFTEITSIYSNNVSDNYVVYDGRIKFKLGTCEDLESKIYRALAACEQLNESSPNVKGTMTVDSDKSVYFTEEEV